MLRLCFCVTNCRRCWCSLLEKGRLLFFFLPLGSQCETLGSKGMLEYSPASSEGCEGPKQTASRATSPESMEN